MEAESITPINDALRMRQSQNGLLFGGISATQRFGARI